MRQSLFSLGFLAFLLAGPAARATTPGGTLNLTLSPGFLRDFRDLGAGSVTPARVREGIASGRDNFEMANAHFDLHTPVPLKAGKGWPTEYAFYLELEGAGAVTLPDPNGNTLQTSRMLGGIFRNAFQGWLGEEFHLETALSAGVGSERREEFVDTGTIARGTQKNLTGIVGLDLRLQKIWRMPEAWIFSATAGTEETFFPVLKREETGYSGPRARSVAHDWLVRGDALWKNFNGHVLAGRHPYPTRILSRTWNRIADPANYDSFASQWALGLGYALPIAKGARLAALGGYYGGALGGELRLRFSGAADIRLASYGVENSSSSRRQNQRTYSLAAEIEL